MRLRWIIKRGVYYSPSKVAVSNGDRAMRIYPSLTKHLLQLGAKWVIRLWRTIPPSY